ncbi:MAG: hypothetical protein U5L11_08025 [Arhodomonas sp.]|nr:hypothetical protein [Arhodomonas sp.]
MARTTTMHAETPNNRASLTWRPLLIFAGYRLVVALLLLAGLVVGGPTRGAAAYSYPPATP